MSKQAIIKRIQALESENEELQLCFIHQPIHMDTAIEVKYIGQNQAGYHEWEVPWDEMDKFGRAVDEFKPESDKRFTGGNAINPLHIVMSVIKPVRDVKVTRGE